MSIPNKQAKSQAITRIVVNRINSYHGYRSANYYASGFHIKRNTGDLFASVHQGYFAVKTPPGFASVTPRFCVRGADAFMRFLLNGLGGTEVPSHRRADGLIANAQVKLGNTTVMLCDDKPAYPSMCAAYWLYVGNADVIVKQALEHGATLEIGVADMPCGEHQEGIRDQHCNI